MRPVYRQALFALFVSVVLVSSLLAFDFTPYLYTGESISDVTSITLSVSGNATYQLHSVKGIPTMLTADGAPLQDGAGIETVLRAHFSSAVMPTSDEVASLRSELLSFNASRNFKTQYGPVEKVCLQYTGLVSSPCDSFATCSVTANVVCGNFAAQGGGGGCYAEILTPLIYNYSTEVKVFNADVPTALSLLSSMSADNASASLSQFNDALARIKTAALLQAQNGLRFPVAGDKCPDCVGLCPATHFDTASLDNASAQARALATRIDAAGSVTTNAKAVAANTADRVAFRQSATQAAIWGAPWEEFKTKYAALHANATAMGLLINDPSITSVLTDFNNRWTAIDNRFTTHHLDGVEADITAIKSKVSALQALLVNGTKPYNDARIAQNHAGDLLTQARWSVHMSDKPSVAAYNTLAARKNALDANFTPPLTTGQYKKEQTAYAQLMNDTQSFISSQGSAAAPLNDLGGQFGQASINGVFSLTDALVPLSASTRTSIAPVIPPVVLFLTDLAVVSVGLVVFIALLVYLKPIFHSRVALSLLVVAMFAFLFVLGLGSVGLFIFINQSSTSGTVGDYVNLVAASNISYVAIDKSNSSDDAIAAMQTCATNISGQLKARLNKTVTLFSYDKSTCLLGNKTVNTSKCLDQVAPYPVMYLHYNKTAANPVFSVVYQKQTDAWGDAAYYTRCEIGDVLN